MAKQTDKKSVDDAQLAKLAKPLIKEGLTASAVIKHLRGNGFSFSGRRVRILFGDNKPATKKAEPKAKAAPKGKAKAASKPKAKMNAEDKMDAAATREAEKRVPLKKATKKAKVTDAVETPATA